MTEREVRYEAIEEWFFPSPVLVNGEFVGAPAEALEKREELLEGWFKEFPVSETVERPSVMLFPVKKDGEWAGFVVRTGVYYPYPPTLKVDDRIN